VEKKSKSEFSNLCRDADFVFIETEPYNVRNSLKLANMVKQSGESTSIVYGTAPSMNPSFFTKYFDFVIQTGHWENAVETLLSDKNLFIKKATNGIYSINIPIPSKDWPHPPLDLLPIKEYFNISGEEQLEINVQKGCVFNCSFCAEKSLIPRHEIYHRDPDNLVEFINNNHGKSFYIDATTFSYNKEWAIAVCDAIINTKKSVSWKTVTRIDSLDEKLVKKMSEAGCHKIGFGIETFSKKLQNKIHKPVDYNKARYISDMLKDNNITPRAFLILGIPGQTAQDVYFTQEKIEEMGMEYRWKEYVPFEKIPFIKDIAGFDEFERQTYAFHNIPNMTRDDYIKLLEIKR
jgi:radical SAM superfamily enzyme YgiQ (UPF0313 family)